jgi:hypothetical protein
MVAVQPFGAAPTPSLSELGLFVCHGSYLHQAKKRGRDEIPHNTMSIHLSVLMRARLVAVRE